MSTHLLLLSPTRDPLNSTTDGFANVEIIDLSLFPESGLDLKTPLNEKQSDTVRRAFTTLRETGFLAITGHGLSKEELRRQFDLGRLFIEDVSEEEKQKLHAKVWDGDWTGYKVRPNVSLPGLWRVTDSS